MRNANSVESAVEEIIEIVAEASDLPISTAIKDQIRATLQKCLQNPDRPLSPPELAKAWGVSPDKILSWIRSGELEAFNVASGQNQRPKYKITPEAIESFCKRRQAKQTPVPQTRRRQSNDVIEFF